MPDPLIDIRPDHWAIVADILRRHVPDREVWAFGSRAKWNAKEYSDLDLALIGQTPLSLSVSAALADDFAESDLPFKVDVVDWETTGESFRKIIERDKVVVQEGKRTGADMGGEWQTIPFEHLLTEPVRNGIYKPKAFHGRGAKIVNMGELFAHPRLRAVPMKRVELSDSEGKRFVLSKGDLLFARRSLVAEVAGKCSIVLEIDEPTTFESSIIRARPDGTKAEPLYLHYFFNSTHGLHCLDTIRRQVAVAGITGSDLSRLEVPVPHISEQRAIAHVLGTLDDKIELNRRMNETLEAMARALFKSWFVDFDPVRAKQSKNVGWVSPSGRNPPDKADGGLRGYAANPPYELPSHIADLFPARLIDSELGEIPEGWEVGRVGNVGNVICGKTPPTQVSEYYGDDVPFITIPDMHGKIFTTATQKRLSLAGAVSQQKKMLPAGAICVSCIATPGLVVITPEPAQTNQQINAVVPSRSDETYFWFWALRDLGDRIRAGGSGGSVLTNLSTGRFAELNVLSPPSGLRSSYHLRVAPVFGRILESERESRTLAALRDTSLPKLISGKLRVPHAVELIDGAVSKWG